MLYKPYEQFVSQIWEQMPKVNNAVYDLPTGVLFSEELSEPVKEANGVVLNFNHASITLDREKCVFAFPYEEVIVEDEQSMGLCLRKLRLIQRFCKAA